MLAFIPNPEISSKSFITLSSIFVTVFSYSETIDWAIGWFENFSICAAYFNSKDCVKSVLLFSKSFIFTLFSTFISVTLKTPFVKVPVLSITTLSTSFNASR